ncbi:uncharacterized protein B0H18DRAFT_479243 [Fomitopsis serialis]|uniref:uncharacterized protein n=1 Tax=Fomitopsis serialis TaxID=139415 RepID=UPI002007599F|nr:uncharacterized protein B0H18DRAFT_479243 [Neoantrodia serialis]KAH9923060.1 hypothetical protein B0H18DRAFT_479243 [Neoantrodia serialis]
MSHSYALISFLSKADACTCRLVLHTVDDLAKTVGFSRITITLGTDIPPWWVEKKGPFEEENAMVQPATCHDDATTSSMLDRIIADLSFAVIIQHLRVRCFHEHATGTFKAQMGELPVHSCCSMAMEPYYPRLLTTSWFRRASCSGNTPSQSAAIFCVGCRILLILQGVSSFRDGPPSSRCMLPIIACAYPPTFISLHRSSCSPEPDLPHRCRVNAN